MNTWQKITVGALASIAWSISLWVSFQYPALAAQMAEIKMAAQGVLSGLGVYHLLITPPPKGTEVPPSTPKDAS